LPYSSEAVKERQTDRYLHKTKIKSETCQIKIRIMSKHLIITIINNNNRPNNQLQYVLHVCNIIRLFNIFMQVIQAEEKIS